MRSLGTQAISPLLQGQLLRKVDLAAAERRCVIFVSECKYVRVKGTPLFRHFAHLQHLRSYSITRLSRTVTYLSFLLGTL